MLKTDAGRFREMVANQRWPLLKVVIIQGLAVSSCHVNCCSSLSLVYFRLVTIEKLADGLIREVHRT